MKVLYVASNPVDASSLNLEREITEFQRKAVATSGEPVQFVFLPNLPFEDLPTQISKNKPDVLHISAHGDEESLSLAHEGRGRVRLTSEMLCTFLDVDPVPKLVYLNSCNSKALAQELTERVPMAIGTDAPITNRAARQAALTFYIGLLEGKSVLRAYEAGRMIMKGLDQSRVATELFFQPGIEPDKCVLHVATRIIARFYQDRVRIKGRDYEVQMGISGCPRSTVQVVFFTSDQTRRKTSCTVVRTTPVRGEIWTDQAWKTHGNFRLFACGVTAGGEHFSLSQDLCSALEQHYVSAGGVKRVRDLPAYMQGAIDKLRRMGHD
jgi:hypothetical protein